MSAVLDRSHIYLAVSDVDRAVRFYTEVFGLVERYGAATGVVYLRIPGTTHHLSLRPDSNAADRVNRFGFPVSDASDADAIIGRVLAWGGSLVRRRHLAPGVVELVVADPDGNVISSSAAANPAPPPCARSSPCIS